MIYDLAELMGRGIIATRTGRFSEAMKYLSLAAQIDPENSRVWLWMAAAEEIPSEKRIFLERARQVDPTNRTAQVLLDRIECKAATVSQPSSDFVIFTCPFCGGKQRFDPDQSGLICEFCKKVETLVPEMTADKPIDLNSTDRYNLNDGAVIESQATCGACGAKVTLLPGRITSTCPFCDSNLVSVQPATPGLISPTGILPFSLHADDILENLKEQPKSLFSRLKPELDPQQLILSPVYLPFWNFQGKVQIRCALSRQIPSNEFSPKDRVIQKRTSFSTKSWYECDIDELLIYAAHSVSSLVIEKVASFELALIQAYRPEMVAGWQAEYYQIGLQDAAITANKRMRDAAFRSAAIRKLFIEPAHMLEGDVVVIQEKVQLLLLPVWIAKGHQANRTALYLINGQTGKVGKIA